eukprot:COSAG04_NODE_945_length_9228_cov_3.344726_8_plen_280_part_00
MEKDEDTTLWVLGLRTLVHDLGGVDPTFDALEFGRFLWERTLMGAREVAPPETVLTTLRDELRLKQPEVAEDEMVASAAALRALFGQFGEVLSAEAVRELVLEADTAGAGHLTYAQVGDHVRDFIQSCFTNDSSAKTLVASGSKDSKKKLSKKEREALAKLEKRQSGVELGAAFRATREVVTQSKAEVTSEEVGKIEEGQVVQILETKVLQAEGVLRARFGPPPPPLPLCPQDFGALATETGGLSRTPEGWITYKKSSFERERKPTSFLQEVASKTAKA